MHQDEGVESAGNSGSSTSRGSCVCICHRERSHSELVFPASSIGSPGSGVFSNTLCMGLDTRSIETKEEIAGSIKEVMQEEKGNEIRKNAKRWKQMAKEAVSEGGSSHNNITEFAIQLSSTTT
ncbi:hypothetical protein Fot_35296 [Forsythia ovata]|uniref:Uncharacterized protein n=1 Tax=Forsythia ovata TaxID=205694 RepID=A0ABD1SM77_9LAMI